MDVRKFIRYIKRATLYKFDSSLSRFVEDLFRLLYIYPTITVLLFSVTVVLLMYRYTDADAIVIVTAFYASVLFLNSMFRGDTPIPKISPRTNDYEDVHFTATDYLGKRDESDGDIYCAKTEFAVQNLGNGELKYPKIEFKVFDKDYHQIQNWISCEVNDENLTVIKPFSEERLDLIGGPISENEEADYHLVIRVKQGIGHSLIRDRKTIRIGGGKERVN